MSGIIKNRDTYRFKGVAVNWLQPNNAKLFKEHLVFGGGIYRAKVMVFNHGIEVLFFIGPNLTEEANFRDVNEFTEYWDILERRVLIEKIGYCL